jgi:L-galactose dehydrogenase
MKYRSLGQTGLEVSIISFGASSLGGVFRDVSEAEAIRTVHVALDAGVNFIDVSPYYGATKAETVLGKALREVSRECYYLATKVGQYGEGEFDFSKERVMRSVEESMLRLGVDYIDLIQCHDIEFADLKQITDETLPALHRLKAEGKVGHVGITGLPLKIFPAIIDATEPGTVESILSFCHYELNDTTLEEWLPYFAQKGVGVINASPTGMGLLTERKAPKWHPASATIQAGCRKAVEFCRKQGIDIVELAVQFAVANPQIATTLVGSANPDNICRNIAAAMKPINVEHLRQVQEILSPIRNFNFVRGRLENRDPLIA